VKLQGVLAIMRGFWAVGKFVKDNIWGSSFPIPEIRKVTPEIRTVEEKHKEVVHPFITNIDVLDKLLGLEEGKPEIEPGSIILIRGEPGSGKTTLGLQILSKYFRLANVKERKDKEKKAKVIFYSLESKPREVLEDVKEKYDFFASEKFDVNDGKFGNIATLGKADLEREVFSGKNIIKRIINELNKCVKLPPNTSWIGLLTFAARGILSLLSYIIYKLSHIIYKLSQIIYRRKSNRDPIIGPEDYCPIVFVDSLSVLIQLLQKHWKYKDIPERLLLNAVCESFRNLFKDSVIIFTGEYHYKDVTRSSIVSESFFCDVEIALFSEPIVVPSDYESQFESPLGSNTLSLLNPEKVKSIQTQSFCRVLKSRHTPNQTRRCAYDIVDGKGIEFFETYPGDGHLTLFYENKEQERNWNIFFNQALPQLYPALRYDSFDRGSLQRVSAAQRRFRYVPQRTDVYLSSFDNYWLNWYSEMCLKDNIADILKREVGIDDIDLRKKDGLPKLLNDIHAALTKTRNQVDFGRDVREIWKNFFGNLKPPVPDKIKNKLINKDVFNDFFSGLLNTLTRAGQNGIDKDRANNKNRPCLRCLWDRYLINQIYDKLSEETQEGFFEYCRNILRKENKQTSGKPLENRMENLIKDLITTCKVNQADKCNNKITPDRFENKTFMVECLKDKREKCKCKRIIKAYIIKFLRSKAEYKSHILKKDVEDHNKIFKNIDDFGDKIIDAMENSVFHNIFAYKPDKEDSTEKLYDLIEDGLKCLSGKLIAESDVKHKELWITILVRLFFDVTERPTRYRLISPVPGDELRLFGERRSEIIAEMESHHPDTRRPVHRPWHLFSLRDQNSYYSIPYDANISFLAFRKDILGKFYKEINKPESSYVKKRYIVTIIRILKAQKKILQQNIMPEDDELDEKSKEWHSKLHSVVKELVDKSIERKSPETWEEIIAFYLLPLKMWRKSKEKNTKLDFLIETRTPDSYLCTMMEFIWSCGANLRIFPDYSIDHKKETINGLKRAFYLLGLMFQNGIIPKNSTLDVNEFAQIYGRPKSDKKEEKNHKDNKTVKPDWVFARHWYSTLVDILSAPKKKGNNQPATSDSDFLWQHKGANLGIMPIPVSFSNYAKYKENVWHISCWGDWHLAMLSDSENTELGIELVNELMGSDRICERASANASVPTVEAYYKEYGDNICFNQPARKDIELPDCTYKDLRETFFKQAKSRSQIFDYHHCIRELHSLMQYVHFNAQKEGSPNGDKVRLNQTTFDNISAKLEQALKNIENFKNKPFLLA
jgi:hypothetical protein